MFFMDKLKKVLSGQDENSDDNGILQVEKTETTIARLS